MADQQPSNSQRGRHATKPEQIPKLGWLDILFRVKQQVSRDNTALIAAGVAFYGLLALFPAIVSIISIWALMFDTQQITQQIAAISRVLPPEAAELVRQQAEQAGEGAGTGMNLAAIGGILLTLYSSSKGMKGLMEGLNIIYGEQEKRSLVKKTSITLALTLGAIVVTLVTLGTIIVIPATVALLGLDNVTGTLINLARWPLLLIVAMLALAILYRYAPDRANPRWHWISIGSITAVLLWIAGSIGFSLYVRSFGNFNQTYGSLGAFVILLMWFWLSAFIVLMGAQLNSEMEHQTKRDTTTGPSQPMGKRGAYVADTLGEKHGQ